MKISSSVGWPMMHGWLSADFLINFLMKAAIVVMVGVESWERPGRVADPLSLVVDFTSWYDEEQLRLVKGTN